MAGIEKGWLIRGEKDAGYIEGFAKEEDERGERERETEIVQWMGMTIRSKLIFLRG